MSAVAVQVQFALVDKPELRPVSRTMISERSTTLMQLLKEAVFTCQLGKKVENNLQQVTAEVFTPLPPDEISPEPFLIHEIALGLSDTLATVFALATGATVHVTYYYSLGSA